MSPKDFDQLKSYVTLIVSELHKVVFNDNIFTNTKKVLRLSEEMECAIMNMEARQKEKASNVLPFTRIA